MEILTLHSQAETIWATHFSNFFLHFPFSYVVAQPHYCSIIRNYLWCFAEEYIRAEPSYFFLSYVLGFPRISLHDDLVISKARETPLYYLLYIVRVSLQQVSPVLKNYRKSVTYSGALPIFRPHLYGHKTGKANFSLFRWTSCLTWAARDNVTSYKHFGLPNRLICIKKLSEI